MPTEHELGDAPIQAAYREQMNGVARTLDDIFNGMEKKTRAVGFVLLVFPFADIEEKRCNFISNGARRKDLAVLFREMAARFEGQPEVRGGKQ